MTDQKQLDQLRQGTRGWNIWRYKHPKAQVNLSFANLIGVSISGAYLIEANFRGADLSFIDLTGADLTRANLIGANLTGANLSFTNLSNADLTGANLSNADLTGANLSNADLTGANLTGTNLSNADLTGANLTGANLTGANLTGATIGRTTFGDVDLRTVKGLEMVKHLSPSTIGIDTLMHSQGDIPEVFLRGVGLPDTFIDYTRSLVSRPIEYYTCFISYSSQDEAFAKRLHADLQQHGVRCWFAPHSLRPGDIILARIDEAIRLYDKLVLILSQHSVKSRWIEMEVTAALTKELKQGCQMLFPLRLDKAVTTTTKTWAGSLWDQRHIADFTGWKAHNTYQQAFTRLLRDLQPDTTPSKQP